jgi:non-heme chloroperoxidase
MSKFGRRLAVSLGLSLLAWPLATAALLIFGTAPAPAVNHAITQPFASLDQTGLPPRSRYRARDGEQLSFRRYPAVGERVAVLIHGSAGSSIDMHPLASALEAAGVAVYVPDIRGHGADRPHGEIAYVGQLESDLTDLLAAVHPEHAAASWTLIGFSSGGGFALRMAAERRPAPSFDRYVLISPYLKYNAPSMRGPDDPRPASSPAADTRSWAAPSIGRIVALTWLNDVGLHHWDGLPVVRFAVPADLDDVTAAYSWRLLQNFQPHADYRSDIRAVERPMQVIVGGADELFVPERMRAEFQAERPDIPVSILPGMGHADMVTRPAAIGAVVAAVVR